MKNPAQHSVEINRGWVMAGEWQSTTLGRIARFDSGHRNSQDAIESGEYPFFTCSREILRHSEFDFDTEAVIMAGNNADARFHLQYYKGRFAARQRTYIITPASDDVVCRYLYYVLHKLQPHFVAHAQGTTTKFVTIGILRNAPVLLPPASEQRAIAHILGTLDDKIELNRRMNETLEAIAQAMFRSWFVDFDPVRAKASGEAPESICSRLGLTPELLTLFPDRLVDSEFGEVPQGWAVKPLDGIASYLNGLALQKFPPESDAEWLPVIKIAQLKKGDAVGADRASRILQPEYIVGNGDVLFSWSGSLEVDVWCGGRGALNQHLFKVTSADYPKWFYFYWTKHHLAHFRAIAAGKAVTMGHIQRKHLTEALCAVPNEGVLRELDGFIAPLLDAQIENKKSSRTLMEVRDTLLPRLLSGELRAPEKEAA